MRDRLFQPIVFCVTILVVACSFAGCGRTDNGAKPTDQTPVKATPQAPPLTEFEKDLQKMRSGQFTYIWVFSRKDGKPIDKEDGTYFRTNAPQVVDWYVTDEGKKVIAGTNFNLEEGNLNMLKKRFVAEDYTGR